MEVEREIQSVLRCGLCNKPFDKQSMLKRHGYYCRSRRAGPTTRSRSCISCARRKARCDNKRPECSRCSAKDVECHYPSLTPRNKDSNVPSTKDSAAGSGYSLGGDPTLTIADPEPYSGIVNPGLSSEVDHLNWNDYDSGLDLDFTGFDFLDPILQANEKPAEYQYPIPTSLPTDTVHHSTPSPFSAGAVQPQQLHPQSTIPPLPSLPRLLIYRPESTTGGKRTTTLILHTLKSYLVMMLRENTLPPFIHPHSAHPSSLPPDMRAQDSYNPLGNCISLVQTLGASRGKNRKLFWGCVQTECTKMCSRDYQSKLNRWELLGAMQALSVYILIRLDEGEAEDNNLDFLFLASATAIAQQLCNGDAAHDITAGLYNKDEGVTWMGWIFEESRRRLSIIYRIINMLVYFEPAARCDLPTDLVLAPLPAKKPLWEANDEVVWKAETESAPRLHQTAFGIAVSGSLVRLDKENGCREDDVLSHMALDAGSVSRNPADWEEWCSGMDGFGGLVMLAASLVV